MNNTNFLIGRGELLTSSISPPKRPPGKTEVYSLIESQDRLLPQITETARTLSVLPSDACPQNVGVALFAMNPSYIARSYFPSTLMKKAGLEVIGSRAVNITPKSWSKKEDPRPISTTELYVLGDRSRFAELNAWASQLIEGTSEAEDFTRIERIKALLPENRITNSSHEGTSIFEVGMHLTETRDFVGSFLKYADKVGVKIHADLSFTAGGLIFYPAEGKYDSVKKLSLFSLIRVIRPMPQLRGMRPIKRSSGVKVVCTLPDEQPLSSEPKVAILDGGLPNTHCIGPWVSNYRKMDEHAADDPDSISHGLAVSSAFLFGPIEPNKSVPRPYSYVDHLRVLDHSVGSEDPLELYRTLGLIEEVLLSRQYQFVNLSLGPDLPIEDTDVHAWTSVIDDLLSDGETLMTIAVGNNGERDREVGNARVQVPSDCVNALAVGAADSRSADWARAAYSAVGPGRSPGIVKPDLLAFGGDAYRPEYFHVLTEGPRAQLSPELGTSFAAPFLLRSAVGIRAMLGADLSPLAIKALLIHGARNLDHPRNEVGWGKIPEDMMDLITCPDGVARIVYQGELKAGKYLRAPLPLPEGGLSGKVQIKATFCYACPTDPQDSCSYTRAGLEVVFRPNKNNVKAGKSHANSKSFFSKKPYTTEAEARSDLGKWETVLHSKIGTSGIYLDDPVFDIHYNAREAGHSARLATKIRYALIISVEALKHPDLFNEVLKSYADLVSIRPKVSLPIRV